MINEMECPWGLRREYAAVFVGIAGSNPVGGMDVCLLRVLGAVR